MSQRSGVLGTVVWLLCDPRQGTGFSRCPVEMIKGDPFEDDGIWVCAECLRDQGVLAPPPEEIALAHACFERLAKMQGRSDLAAVDYFSLAQAYAILALAEPKARQHDAIREEFRSANAAAALAESFFLHGILTQYGSSRVEHGNAQKFFRKLTDGLDTREEATA